ncbi:response regulator [Paenibacillus piri]|uniref:Response regulator n=2 Tax=Paenibacillus piri TaxID=2547395 RepID=A0A4R5KW78_9BACL|nr:response regulator [Paenibacillus piri]
MVCTGIETIVRRTGFDWHIAGKAANGHEALSILETTPVDCVVTDIKMPDMNGLDMMERIYHSGYECEIIILTSYADFEFAQKALKYRAVNYLLKPVDPDELIENIKKVEEAIQDRLIRRLEQEQLTKNKDMMTRMILTRLLFEYGVEETKMKAELEQVGIRLSKLLIVTVGHSLSLTDEEREELRRKLFAELGSAPYHVEDVSIENRLLVLIVWVSEGHMDMDEIEAKLRRVSGQLTEIPVSFGISDVCANLTAIAATFNQSICSYDWALKIRSRIAHFRDVDVPDHVLQYPYALEHKLLFAFKSGLSEDIHRLTGELAGVIFDSNRTSNLYHLVMISSQTLAAFKRLYLEMTNSLDQLIKLDLDAHIHLARFSSVDMVKQWFLENMEHVTVMILKSKKLKSRKIIEQVKQIIFDRYGKELQIRDIADKLFMNASYLSDLFKQYTGTTFTEFVIEYRMQMAKELLLNEPTMKMYEIAEAVGYKNPKHFSQVFKKYVGVLPTDFREI